MDAQFKGLKHDFILKLTSLNSTKAMSCMTYFISLKNFANFGTGLHYILFNNDLLLITAIFSNIASDHFEQFHLHHTYY